MPLAGRLLWPAVWCAPSSFEGRLHPPSQPGLLVAARSRYKCAGGVTILSVSTGQVHTDTIEDRIDRICEQAGYHWQSVLLLILVVAALCCSPSPTEPQAAGHLHLGREGRDRCPGVAPLPWPRPTPAAPHGPRPPREHGRTLGGPSCLGRSVNEQAWRPSQPPSPAPSLRSSHSSAALVLSLFTSCPGQFALEHLEHRDSKADVTSGSQIHRGSEFNLPGSDPFKASICACSKLQRRLVLLRAMGSSERVAGSSTRHGLQVDGGGIWFDA